MSLAALPDPTDETNEAELDVIPAFEGHEVHGTKLRLVSALALEIDDRVLRHDHIVRLAVEARIVGVDHRVNDRNGSLDRIHTAKVLEVEFLPWTPGEDDGVLAP